MTFEWTPGFWRGWRESSNPYREYKSERDRTLTVQALDPRAGERILEVGCGYGWISAAICGAADIRWIGIDRSEAMLRSLRSTASATTVPSVMVGDATRLPFATGAFDAVVCTGVLMHIADEFAALEELTRVLRPGGRLVCSMNNSLSPPALPVRAWNSTKSGFVQVFRTPGAYVRHFRRLGLEVRDMRGDGVLATVSVMIAGQCFPPKSLFRFLVSADRWCVSHAPKLAFEIWFAAVKGARTA